MDMMLAFMRNNATLQEMRKEMAIKELNEEKVVMIDIFDRIADEAIYNRIIELSKKAISKGKTEDVVIEIIADGLDVSLDAAKEIFESEVLNMVTA